MHRRSDAKFEVFGDYAAKCVTWPESDSCLSSKGECVMFRSMLCSLVMLGVCVGFAAA